MSHQHKIDESFYHFIQQIHFARFSSYAKIIVTKTSLHPFRNYWQFRCENACVGLKAKMAAPQEESVAVAIASIISELDSIFHLKSSKEWH